MDLINSLIIKGHMMAAGSIAGFNTDNMASAAKGFSFDASTISAYVLAALGIGALITGGVVGINAFGRASDLSSDERRRAAGKEALPFLLIAAAVIFAAFVIYFMIQGFVGL